MNNFQERANAWAKANGKVYVHHNNLLNYAIAWRYDLDNGSYTVNGRPLTEVIEEWENQEAKKPTCKVAGVSSEMSAHIDSVREYEYQRGREDAIKELEAQPKKMRLMTHAEVFNAIRDGAVLRMNSDNHVGVAFNGWGCDMTIGMYEICHNYTGTDSDVWQKMEVEE